MDTFFKGADTELPQKFIIVGFDKYYARMLELEGIDLGLNCEKFNSHYDSEVLHSAVQNEKGCLAVINSDALYSENDAMHLIEFLNIHCERIAIIASRRVYSCLGAFISENANKICLFKRPVSMEEFLTFLCKKVKSGHIFANYPQGHRQSLPEVKISSDICSASFLGNIIYFTPKEFGVLKFLLKNIGSAVSRKEIFYAVWGNDDDNSNITDVYIRYLRKKFSAFFNFDVIKTVRGVGYTINTDIIWKE